jgi:class 3 adenylate cyclase
MQRCATCGYESEEPFRFCKQCGAPADVAGAGEQRKRVTALFCDVTASTALGERLDPEILRRVLARYFDTVKGVIEHHGGTVEKFIGDAVMAVFGVPVLHEDDAWRAARAATSLREAMASLNEELKRDYGLRLDVRIGVNTGEVVTGTQERLATGDAINVAARLEQAAAPGEILLGAETYELIRPSVLVEPVAPLVVKGKSAPLTVWRLLAVYGENARQARLRVPMVGRQPDLGRLLASFEQARRDSSCVLVTVLGAAGIGKSRLADEFLASIDGAAVLRAHCLSFGGGITYWPVVEILRQLEPRLPELTADARVRSVLRDLLDKQATTASTEDIAFAVRKLLEAAAREQPLVCVFDDIHWGEPAFLDLIEQVATLAHDVPLLLCCIARSELIEERPAWGAGTPHATTVALESLSPDETETLIRYVAGDAPLRAADSGKIREAAEGNPLFVEEMIGLLRDAPDGDLSVPPTIQALLTARLDQLDPDERAVLQRGAVEGRVFHRGAVQTLAPDEAHVGTRLAALIRKELIHRDRAQVEGEDAYRFHHALIRDAAYETLPKTARAELHERLADWLAERTSDGTTPDEILAYHLEQSFRLRLELWPLDERARALAARASGLLEAAGGRALARNDVDASLNLLRRALALRPDEDPAAALRIDLTQALFLAGEFGAGREMAEEAATRAAAAGDHTGELRARLAAMRMAAQLPRDDAADGEPSAELLALAEQAKPVFARAGDEVGCTDAWAAIAWAELLRGRWTAMLEAIEHAQTHARRGGYTRWERELPAWKATALFYGPTPVDEVLRWYEQERLPEHSMATNHQAVLEAMRGGFDDARALLARAAAAEAESGETVWLVGGGMAKWEVESLAGDVSAAEQAARRTCNLLAALGETGFRSLAAGQLAESLYALDRLDEAERWTRVAEELSSSDDVLSNMSWRQVRAKLIARRGEDSEAERLALEAVGLAEQTDMINGHANALADLAEVHLLGGRGGDAAARLAEALALYERKGNLVLAAKARSTLAEVPETAPLATERSVE